MTKEPGSKADTSMRTDIDAPLFEEETDEQLGDRIAGYVAGALGVHVAALADRLGVFKHMAASPPSTPQEIADGTGLHERWIREMMHQLIAARLVSTDKTASKFWLSSSQAGALAHEDGAKPSPTFAGGMTMSTTEAIKCQDKLMECFRTGKGMKYDDYGDAMTCSICRELGVWTRTSLLPSIKTIDGLDGKLREGITVADLGCGAGEALYTLAKEYPASTFHGYDISKTALCCASKRISSLPNVELHNPAEGQLMGDKEFDFMITLDAIHDMTHPDQVLSAARSALKDGAIGYLIQDFDSTGSAAENCLQMPVLAMIGYGYSLSLCMSSALSEEGGMGLGTLGWHPELATKMLTEAGFASVQQLDWPSPMNAFYLATV